MITIGGQLGRYKIPLFIFVVFLLLLGFFLLNRNEKALDDVEVLLLNGLEQEDTVIPINELVSASGEVDVALEPSPQETIPKNYTDIWKVDQGSRIYRSIGKQGGAEGHDGSIDATGLLFTADDEEGNLVIVTGRSHITFLMTSFDVGNISNDGIKTLFLDHLHSDEALETDVYPFAQFVVDSVHPKLDGEASGEQFDGNDSAWLIDGRLKIKDTIETVSLRDVTIEKQGNNGLFFVGTIEISRYLWGLDLMPGVIDEFISVEFELGLSRI